MDFVILVNDGGELKSIKRHELLDGAPDLAEELDFAMNAILDNRSAKDGEAA